MPLGVNPKSKLENLNYALFFQEPLAARLLRFIGRQIKKGWDKSGIANKISECFSRSKQQRAASADPARESRSLSQRASRELPKGEPPFPRPLEPQLPPE